MVLIYIIYETINYDVPTVAVNGQLVTSIDQPADLIYGITKALWSKKTRGLLDKGHSKGKVIQLKTALKGVLIPVHPGAQKFYKEKGMKYTFKFYDSQVAKKLMSENYDIGNDYAKHTLRVTPGQSENDVDEMLGVMEKKRTSMREALAKVWGLDEGKSPFEKKEMKKEMKKEKTMTGKKPTPVEVDPEVKD